MKTLIISEKKLENAQIEIQIEVPENRVEIEYKSVINNIRNSAKIDGFRKGKAPIDLIERKYMEIADKEVAENLLRTEYYEAVKEKDFKPISMPQFDFESISRGKTFTFKAIFEIMPTVQLGEYKGLVADERMCAITDDDVTAEIDALRERNANISKKEDDGKVEKGDLARIKVKRIDTLDESEIEETPYRDYSIVVGKSKSEYTFDDHILDMKAGEEKEVKIKYPKDYEVADLAGQSARYLVKIDEISRMELPAPDDDFAKDLGEYATIEEMKNGIKSNLEKFVADRSKGEAKGKLLKEIVKNSTFDIPMSMVEKEMDSLFHKVQERTGYYTEDINEFTSTLGIDADEFSHKLRDEAFQNIQTMLVLSEIAQKEELKVPEEQYKKVLEGLAARTSKNIEEVEKIIADNNSREGIETELVLDVALDFIYENATVKKGAPLSLAEFVKN